MHRRLEDTTGSSQKVRGDRNSLIVSAISLGVNPAMPCRDARFCVSCAWPGVAGPGSPAAAGSRRVEGITDDERSVQWLGRRKILRLYSKPYVVATVFRPQRISIGLPRPSVNALNADMQYRRVQAETIIPLSVRNRTSGK